MGERRIDMFLSYVVAVLFLVLFLVIVLVIGFLLFDRDDAREILGTVKLRFQRKKKGTSLCYCCNNFSKTKKDGEVVYTCYAGKKTEFDYFTGKVNITPPPVLRNCYEVNKSGHCLDYEKKVFHFSHRKTACSNCIYCARINNMGPLVCASECSKVPQPDYVVGAVIAKNRDGNIYPCQEKNKDGSCKDFKRL